MKKLIYKNIILIVAFLILPWFYLDSSYRLGFPNINSSYLFGLIVVGLLCLFFVNIWSIVNLQGKSKIAPALFLLIPVIIIMYFVIGTMAFSNYTGF